MSVKTIPDTRQWPLAFYAPFSYEDALGVADAAMVLAAVPAASIFTFLQVTTTVAFASGGGTHDLNLGDATDVDEYSGTAIELDGTAGAPANNAVLSGFLTTSDEPNLLGTFIDGTGVATSGAGYVVGAYITTTRSTENYE